MLFLAEGRGKLVREAEHSAVGFWSHLSEGNLHEPLLNLATFCPFTADNDAVVQRVGHSDWRQAESPGRQLHASHSDTLISIFFPQYGVINLFKTVYISKLHAKMILVTNLHPSPFPL